MVHYDVRCAFADPEVGERWVAWLKAEHLQDLLDVGAISARVVRVDAPETTFEARYVFPDRDALDRYLSEHAPRLRQEGLERFPLTLGLRYSRTIAEAI